MGNIQFFEAADVPEATVATSSEQADSPASRLVVVGPRWGRSWRSTGAGAQTGTVTFTGGSQDIVGFVAYDANFSSMVVNGVTYPVSADLDGMYKLFKAVTFSASDVDFSIPSQATTDGLSYFRLGRLLFFTNLYELEECPESITREIFDPQVVAESDLGVFDTLPAGAPYSRESMSGKFTGDTLPNVRRLFNRRAHQWAGVFRNLNTARDYEFCFWSKESGTRVTYGNVTVDLEVGFRQQM